MVPTVTVYELSDDPIEEDPPSQESTLLSVAAALIASPPQTRQKRSRSVGFADQPQSPPLRQALLTESMRPAAMPAPEPPRVPPPSSTVSRLAGPQAPAPSAVTLDPVTPDSIISSAQFNNPRQRLMLLFDVREYLPEEYHSKQFLFTVTNIHSTFVDALLATLRDCTAQNDYYLMVLSVLKEALSGAVTLRPESVDAMCQAIRACVQPHHTDSIETLTTNTALSEISPLFLALFEPAAYEYIFEAFGINEIECFAWPALPPGASPNASPFAAYLLAARAGNLELEEWCTTCVTVSDQLRDLFNGEPTPLSVHCIRSIIHAARLDPDDALRFVRALRVGPVNPTTDDAVAVILNCFYLSQFPHLLSAEVLLGLYPAQLLRWMAAWMQNAFFPSSFTAVQMAEEISSFTDSETNVHFLRVDRADNLLFVFTLPVPLWSAFFARHPHRPKFYELQPFLDASLAERR